jgi:hypothetical protein
MDEEFEDRIDYYIQIGVITVEGVDKDGEIIYSIDESAKELAPELWESHQEYVDRGLLDLYNRGLIEIEYDENLEATIWLSEEGKEIAETMGYIDVNREENDGD